MEFKKFSHKALNAYIQWVKERYDVDLKLEDPPEVPMHMNLLTGTADAMIVNPQRVKWPVLVKSVWQSSNGPAMSVEEIAKKRNNFYLEQVNGEWKVKELSAVYLACQNIMTKYYYENMDLICHCDRNDSLLVVPVQRDRKFYFNHFGKMSEEVHGIDVPD